MTDDIFVARRLDRASRENSLAMGRVLAFITLARPRVTATQWLAFRRSYGRRQARRAGVMVIEDRRGYVHAVFRYDVDASYVLGADPAASRNVLRLRDLVCAHMPGATIDTALAACADRMAARLGCHEIRLELPDGPRDASKPSRAIFGSNDRESTIIIRVPPPSHWNVPARGKIRVYPP